MQSHVHPAAPRALTPAPLPATRPGSRLALVFVLGLITLLGALRAFFLAGQWLIVQDPLSAGRAAVVFGGQAPLRAMEAAAIYEQGWAREVWLTQGSVLAEDRALDDLQIDRPAEHELSRRALLRLGVPESAIRILPGRNENTADEVRTIAAYLDTLGDREAGVILITSKPHSRRVRTLWHRLAATRPDAIV